jgi:hypothetical protein
MDSGNIIWKIFYRSNLCAQNLNIISLHTLSPSPQFGSNVVPILFRSINFSAIMIKRDFITAENFWILS